jgi:hypothetical protein
LVLAALADNDGIVCHEKDEIETMLGLSRATLNKRLKAANVTTNSVGQIVVKPIPAEVETFLATIFESPTSESTVAQTSSVTWQDVVQRYIDVYHEVYGVKPRIDHRMKKNVASAFLRKYGEDSTRLVEFIVRRYNGVWSTPQYDRPTFGAVCGWIAEKAITKMRVMDAQTKVANDNEGGEWL